MGSPVKSEAVNDNPASEITLDGFVNGMNGRIERFWRTLKDALTLFGIRNEDELQATLEVLKTHYNQHRPHQ